MKIPFTKMQGAGNDVVVIDNLQQNISLTAEQICQMADRHFGIGFDHLLMVTPPPPGQNKIDFGYKIYNADGSEAQQCGNGARCFARFVYENKLTTQHKFWVATISGNIELEIKEDHQVSVNMGIPILEPSLIPFKAKALATEYTLEINDRADPIKLGAVSMGNPHAVIQVDSIEKAPVSELGRLLNNHPDFPEQVNVGFMQVLDAHYIRLRVYERGVGETLACGSGACAAVVAGHLQGLLAEDVLVYVLGGALFIHWEGQGSPVWMTGPAEFVFTGVYETIPSL